MGTPLSQPTRILVGRGRGLELFTAYDVLQGVHDIINTAFDTGPQQADQGSTASELSDPPDQAVSHLGDHVGEPSIEQGSDLDRLCS